MTAMSDLNLTESWYCVDCGINTASGILGGVEMKKAFNTARTIGKLTGKNEDIEQVFTNLCESTPCAMPCGRRRAWSRSVAACASVALRRVSVAA